MIATTAVLADRSLHADFEVVAPGGIVDWLAAVALFVLAAIGGSWLLRGLRRGLRDGA